MPVGSPGGVRRTADRCIERISLCRSVIKIKLSVNPPAVEDAGYSGQLNGSGGFLLPKIVGRLAVSYIKRVGKGAARANGNGYEPNGSSVF